MSVYKSKRGESSVQFIETARQLEAHTFACCMKAPKRYERFLTGRIMELSSEVHDRVRAANNIWPTNRHEAQLRRDELMRANNALQNLSPKLQLLYDSMAATPRISAMSTATATPTTTTRAMRMAWPSDSARDGSGQ